MSVVKIVYWSGTGNTEAMAQAVADGAKSAGADAQLIPVGTASVADLAGEKAFALGGGTGFAPAMTLEEGEMEPFMAELEGSLGGKTVGLFGSYGWGNQEWMRDWEDRCKSAGASVVNDEGVAFLGAPDDATVSALQDLGAALAARA